MASKIEDIILEITEYIDQCKPQMLSSANIIVNRDDIENLLDELRQATPEEIRKYQKIISNQEAILADARSKADAIVAQAEVKTQDLVSEHQIMQQAYAQANEVVMVATKQAQDLIDKATRDANGIRTGAIAYTDDLLKTVQEVLVRSMGTTRNQADSYLNTMQQYLDVVTKNRLELNPNNIEAAVPSEDTRAAAKAPAAAKQTAQTAAANPKSPSAGGQPQPQAQVSGDKKDAPADAKGKGVSGISEGFFNKD